MFALSIQEKLFFGFDSETHEKFYGTNSIYTSILSWPTIDCLRLKLFILVVQCIQNVIR